MLNAISRHPDFSYEQQAATRGVSRPTIARTVKALQMLQMIKRIGSDKTGHWDIIETHSLKTD